MAQRKTPNESATRWLTIRVDREQADRFRVVAAADHRTVSQELRRLIELRIAESETEEKAA
jgi:hypothetical protein